MTSSTPLRRWSPAVWSPEDNANVQHYAINCSDDPMTQADIAAAVDGVDPLYAGLVADQATRDADACDALGLTQLPDSTDAPLAGDLPTLLHPGRPGSLHPGLGR